jgi:NAD-dependent protein deacetylase/lipoamidase
VNTTNFNLSEKFKSRIKSAEKIVFFTGAGISAESGIPIFRGKDGIWNKLKPEELANFNSFLKNPNMVWEWYNHRKQIVHNSRPNEAHISIVKMQEIFPSVIVVTQNIDNLHRRAGSKYIYELHGNIEKNYCIQCGKRYDYDFEFEGKVPKCSCGGLIRPDIVWFGEFLPEDQFNASEQASERCDIFFIVGTSAVVYPAASLIYTAKAAGAFLVEINIEETEISSIVNESCFGKAGEILPMIYDEIRKIRNSN